MLRKAGLALFVLAACATGAVAASALPRATSAPPISYGVADNTSLFANDGGAWFYSQLKGVNFTENRWELQWDATNPTAITQLAFLQRAAPVAQAAGIHVVLVLDSNKASNHDPNAFCAWAATVASTASRWGIHDFIVWNEPNTAVYWAPQTSSSPADYEALLAKCYDAIHAADSQARVIGFGLSPRSNGPTQTAPIPFILGVAAAYRASGRKTPIMDQMSIHPYPNPNHPIDSPDVGYTAANVGSFTDAGGNKVTYLDDYGIPNLDRVKQAIYTGFNGTGQPTTLNGLTFRIDELGWQTDTTQYPQYYNPENVPVVSEDTQAFDIARAIRYYFACDPTVTDVELFLLVDEATRNGKSQDGSTTISGGWQSGLLTAGGQGVSTPKASYTMLATDFPQGRDACIGPRINWVPSGGKTTTTTTTTTTTSKPTAKPVGTMLRQLTAPFVNGRALAFDGSHLYAGAAGATYVFKLDATSGKSLGNVRIAYRLGNVSHCCAEAWAADYANGQLYLAGLNNLYSTSAPSTVGQSAGQKLWAEPEWTCSNGGGVGINPWGFVVLPSGTYAFAGPAAHCVVFSNRVVNGLAKRTGGFPVSDPMPVQGLARDGSSGLWVALGNGSNGKLVHFTTAGKSGTSIKLAGYSPTGIAYDSKTFAPTCALWTNESRTSGAAHIRAYAVPCNGG